MSYKGTINAGNGAKNLPGAPPLPAFAIKGAAQETDRVAYIIIVGGVYNSIGTKKLVTFKSDFRI